MEKKKFVLTDEWKQHAFTTPEGYFDTLQDRVAQRIAAPQISWMAALRPQLAFAAGFAALVVAGYGGLFMLNNLKGDIRSTVAPEDENAITASILGIDEDMVLHALSERQPEEVDTGDIINYLADAHISITDIASLE